MRLWKHRWIALALAVMCITVQALVIVPHHHHGDGEMPCFNIVHCIEHEAGHETEAPAGCCHDHCTPEQEPAADHECSVKIDVAEVITAQTFRCAICESALINDFYAPDVLIPSEHINTLHSFTLTRWRQQPDPVDKCVLFIAEAISPRAPSLV